MLDLLPDLFDDFPEQLQLAEPIFTDYGGSTNFSGEIVTVSCLNDNYKIKELVSSPGHGKVLVIDGKASLSNALLGDMLAEFAIKNGWQGVVINGCIRDVATVATMSLPIKALGCNPIKGQKKNTGEVNITINFAGLNFIPGWYIYGDANGLAISKNKLILKSIN